MIATHRALQSAGWPTVFLVLGAGIVSAFQVGKAPIALAAVQTEFALGLGAAAWLISAFAVIGAVAAAPIGLAVDHIGAKRMAVLGLLVQGTGSALGALAADASTLLAMRVIEGFGYLALIVAAPAAIVVTAPAPHRGRAMALWASFMPVGMTLVMLASPLLSFLTWRGFWVLNAAVLMGYAALLGRELFIPVPAAARRRSMRRDISEALAAPGPWILAGLFGAFSAGFFAVFGLLPSLLSERLGVSSEAAGMLSALAVAVSGVGNLACGQLLVRGVRPKHLLLAAFGLMALSAVGIFSEGVSAKTGYALCVFFSFVTGFIPVVIFDSAPRSAPRPELLGVTVGFAMQGNNIGLVLGPAAAGSIAAAFGWPLVSLVVTLTALFAAALVVKWTTA